MQTLCERDIDLSVIIPVYNLERWLTPMLNSLKAQDHGKYKVEHIFVLNNCTDLSEMVIRDSDLECQILECKTQGCGAARNVGFEASKGKYIWFMDGDDWLLSESAIKNAMDWAIREGTDILRIPFDSQYFTYQYFSMVWQYLFKREFIEEFRFPNIQPSEDDAYMDLVLGKKGLNRMNYFMLPYIPQTLYYYNYLREGSNMYRWHILGERDLLGKL